MNSVDKKYAKLIMVTGANNNKYYEMIYEGGPTFTINYGRIDSTKTTLHKPISKWKNIYNEKIDKGYKDVTALVSVKVEEKTDKSTDSYLRIEDNQIDNFITLMRNYTNDLVKKTYSVKCDKVSQKQIDEAQKILDDLSKIDRKNEKAINDKLIELYTIIPRYMSNVRHNVLPNINLDKTLVQEQDNIDAISSQVSMFQDTKKDEDKKENKEQQTFLEALGIKLKKCDHTKEKEIQYIINQLNTSRRKRIESVYAVEKAWEDNRFTNWIDKQNNKQTRYLIHGTRCTSVIPILREGLKIRPAGNFQFSGKAYGEGNYFSEVTDKSLNYTGYDKDTILLIYEVHTGNPYIYNGWYRGNSFTLNYKNLSERGFDSTHVNAGNGLLNSEIIAYHEHQNRIKYIIHLK